MIMVLELSDFLTGRPHAWPIYRGHYMSREKAEKALGWFYVANNCAII